MSQTIRMDGLSVSLSSMMSPSMWASRTDAGVGDVFRRGECGRLQCLNVVSRWCLFEVSDTSWMSLEVDNLSSCFVQLERILDVTSVIHLYKMYGAFSKGVHLAPFTSLNESESRQHERSSVHPVPFTTCCSYPIYLTEHIS